MFLWNSIYLTRSNAINVSSMGTMKIIVDRKTNFVVAALHYLQNMTQTLVHTRLNVQTVGVSTSLPPSLALHGNEKREVVSVKVREGLSFPEAKRIVAARMNILTSYANVTKNATKPVEKKDFSTQTIIVAVHKAPVELTSSAKGNVSDSHEPQCNTNNSKQNKSAPSTSQTPAPVSKTQGPRPNNKSNKNKTKVVESDRQPKGSDDPIKNHNRFSCLDEDMEVENPIAESSTQGKIKKITFPK